MPSIVNDLFALFGFLASFLGFLIVGVGIGRFVLDNYKASEWQVRIALALGFFGLLIGIAGFTSPGSSGAFALGSGLVFLTALMPRKTASEEESKITAL